MSSRYHNIKVKVEHGNQKEIIQSKTMAQDTEGPGTILHLEREWGDYLCMELAFKGMLVRRTTYFLKEAVTIRDQVMEPLIFIHFQANGESEYIAGPNEKRWLCPGGIRISKNRKLGGKFSLGPGEHSHFTFFFDAGFLLSEMENYKFLQPLQKVLAKTSTDFSLNRFQPEGQIKKYQDTLSGLFARSDLGRHQVQAFVLKVVEEVLPRFNETGKRPEWEGRRRNKFNTPQIKN